MGTQKTETVLYAPNNYGLEAIIVITQDARYVFKVNGAYDGFEKTSEEGFLEASRHIPISWEKAYSYREPKPSYSFDYGLVIVPIWKAPLSCTSSTELREKLSWLSLPQRRRLAKHLGCRHGVKNLFDACLKRSLGTTFKFEGCAPQVVKYARKKLMRKFNWAKGPEALLCLMIVMRSEVDLRPLAEIKERYRIRTLTPKGIKDAVKVLSEEIECTPEQGYTLDQIQRHRLFVDLLDTLCATFSIWQGWSLASRLDRLNEHFGLKIKADKVKPYL